MREIKTAWHKTLCRRFRDSKAGESRRGRPPDPFSGGGAVAVRFDCLNCRCRQLSGHPPVARNDGLCQVWSGEARRRYLVRQFGRPSETDAANLGQFLGWAYDYCLDPFVLATVLKQVVLDSSFSQKTGTSFTPVDGFAMGRALLDITGAVCCTGPIKQAKHNTRCIHCQNGVPVSLSRPSLSRPSSPCSSQAISSGESDIFRAAALAANSALLAHPTSGYTGKGCAST